MLDIATLAINNSFLSDVKGRDYVFPYGKYRGLSVDEIGNFDQDYLRFMARNGINFTKEIMDDLNNERTISPYQKQLSYQKQFDLEKSDNFFTGYVRDEGEDTRFAVNK